MVIWDWFREQFNKDDNTLELDVFIGSIASKIYYKELAIQSAINLISNVVSRSEFQTFEEGKEVKKDNYYLFNVEPNPNKSASKFWRDVISKLVYDNEALIVQQGGYFYCADSFEVKKFAFKEYIYDNIEIDGFGLNNAYNESQVLHLELHNEKVRKLVDGLYKDYGKLIEVSQGNFKKNNSRKLGVKVPTNYPETEKATQKLKDLFQNKFKEFFEAEGPAVVPLVNGLEVEELKSNIGVKGGSDNNQIRAFIDDIFDFVGIALQIPPVILKGQVAESEDVFNQFITYCINPLAELLEDEINRKYYGKNAYLNNTYLKVNTSNIKAVDITDVAEALDVLTRIGGYSIDDTLKKLGMEPLNTEWSKARWMTKNYQRVEQRYEGTEEGGGG
jgi:HK97 family phage portal protein